MSWRGIDGAISAAKAGHDTVLSPAPRLYIITGKATEIPAPVAQQRAHAEAGV